MFLYRRADLVVAVAQGTIDILKERGIPESKMALIPNGVDIDFFRAKANGRQVREHLGVVGQFVVGYIGTHGMAHKLDTVIEAADKLRGYDDIRFIFVGDGAEKESLLKLAAGRGIGNVSFHNQISRDLIPEYYAACDLCLVPLRKAELFTKNIPSKIYEIMAAKRPIIISTEGESRRLVEISGAGLAVQPENSDDLARRILELKKDRKLREKMGQSGFSFVLANSSRARLADDYLAILNRVSESSFVPPLAKRAKGTADNNIGVPDGERVSV
jgi:glycosyltransferase involved in cell wall biosynthesis